ncbi:MAG: YbaY family lipoprotein [Anaerolineae bacterium]
MRLSSWLPILLALLVGLVCAHGASAAPRAQTPRVITITSPTAGTVVGSPMTITGASNVFPHEGNMNYRVTDAAGAEIGKGFFQADGTMTGTATFTAALTFDPPAAGGPITLEVYEVNAADGSKFGAATVALQVEALPSGRVIEIVQPPAGATVGAPVTIVGRTSYFPFEGNLNYRVTDAASKEIGAGFFQVQTPCCDPSWFITSVAYTPPAAGGPITVEVYERDAATGNVAVSTSINLQAAAAATTAAVTGTVNKLDRSALPPTAVLEVSLQDVSLADAPAKVIGTQTIENPGQLPVNFSVSYNTAVIEDFRTYSVRATIKDGGKLIYTSTQMYRAITRGAPTSGIEIMVQPVGSSPAPAPTAAAAAVTGTVGKLDRRALAPSAVLEVSLQDVSLADAPAKVIGTQTLQDFGQLPVDFSVSYNPADIQDNHRYSVRATIKEDGKLTYTSTQSYPVITMGAPTGGIEITVQPVG